MSAARLHKRAKKKAAKNAARRKSEPKFGLEDLAVANERAINSAGPRYFPNIDPDFPDMPMESFDEAIVGLVGGDGFRALVEDIKQDLEKGWREFSFRAPQEYRGKLTEPQSVLRALGELADSAPGGGEEAVVKIRQRTKRALKKVDALRNRMDKAKDKHFREHGRYPPGDPGGSVIAYDSALHRALDFMPEWDYSFITGKPVNMRANACGLHQNGSLVLHSEWGMGKTHSLCSLANKQGRRELPALLALAKDLNLEPDSSPGDAIARHAQLADDFDGLLQRLNALGRASGVRALLMVDGVNERNPDGLWKRELGKMLRQVRRFPFVGLVVSFRDPFNHGLSESDLLETPCLTHEGFHEIPIEAQEAFFKYYDVPLPEVPPMAEEFSRPLTLKIICEVFKGLSKKEQRKGFDGIASGQKGMTYILERYIKRRAKAVAEKHSALSGKKIWSLLDEVMAPYMAKNLVEEVPAALLKKAMRDRFSIGAVESEEILRDMHEEGIVIMGRGIPWKRHTPASPDAPPKKRRWRLLVQMPYQRFGDHLVARELLKRHLKTGSADEVRRGFRANNPLGRAFTLEENRHGFRPTSYLVGSGPAEALILEFPERVKKTPGIPDEERELLFYLPHWEEKCYAYRAPFLSGLYWRANDAFSRRTVRLMGGYLRDWEDVVMRIPDQLYHSGEHSVTNALLSLACRRDSPISAKRIYEWIDPMSMSDRDVLWGAATQEARRRDWTRRFFIWLSAIERNGLEKLPAEVARNYVVLLSLFLGATDRPLRDKATRALVAIGEAFPDALFSHALDTLNFNDVYYPERMLAACYGVAMSQWSNPDADKFHGKFPKFARAVARDVFMPGGRLLTHHALVRDYALGIAAIARRLGVKFSEKQEAHMSPPFPAVPSPFPPASEIAEADLSDVDFALHPDFENYTIGRLVANRRNYDSSNKEYADILRQIKWRMKNLGCAKDKFMERDKWIVDRENRRESDYGKVDRYGKKYSWIAYNEMHGWLHAQGRKMPEWWDPKRPVEGVIDPSFPAPSQGWGLKLPPLPMGGDDLRWIARGPSPDYGHILEANELGGDWVMLEGFAVHNNEDESRDLFSFLRGLLVREGDIPQLQEELQKSEDPGDEPRLDKDDHIYAGEIPWSPDFTQLRNSMREKEAFNAVSVETVAFAYAWESHHSEENQFSGACFPAPDICAKLRLSRRGRSVELFDEDGRLASVYHADEVRWGNNVERPRDGFQFLHLRKDLLDRYLRAVGKRLVWIVWGERRLLPKEWFHRANPLSPKVNAAMQNHLNIHKRLIVYPQVKK